MRRAVDGSSVLKIYRGVHPPARRDRESYALERARRWGLRTPTVLATGEWPGHAWSVLSTVPGEPCAVTTPRGLQDYVNRVLAVIANIHGHHSTAPGPGWRSDQGTTTPAHREFLLSQLSTRCSSQSWWSDLRAALAPLDDLPTVHLHGDIKPEHLLVAGEEVHVLDWEASARGPAACDYADVVFHLVRDLVYGGQVPQHLPADIVGSVPVDGPVLAWRTVLWLDRRRPDDIGAMSRRGLVSLADERIPTHTVQTLARLIAGLRAVGVPR
ncbi:aminoglycoside phosphotransferase family protein [Streptomyces wuyuanensis]|uniref:aminoglycoside phosphotransferase family protein n=1 Tax=Streptomyces wuyuanensis TaxID=1196353 RepID=UPI003715E4B9